jgi:hypothetical protein
MTILVSQVVCIDGMWFFNLMDEEFEEDLKDVGSSRYIPIHDKLIEVGFLEARVTGRDPNARLFPEVVSYSEIGGDAGPFGKWFGRLLDTLGLLDPKLNFHSLRHTLHNLLENAGVPRGSSTKLSVTKLSNAPIR